jgi:hypothetical protein
MKTIKKTTLIAAITAMAAFALPSMASAAVWGPINTNKSLDATNVTYNDVNAANGGWTCTSQHLGVHVRTPASSTLDITAASWTSCSGFGQYAGCPMFLTATGLPWTATASTSTAVNFPIHADVSLPCGGAPFKINGTIHGPTWNASAHTVTFTSGGTSGLDETWPLDPGALGHAYLTGVFHDPTNTLTLT